MLQDEVGTLLFTKTLVGRSATYALFLVCLLQAGAAYGQSLCPGTVVFGSGIRTDENDARMTMRVLRMDLRRHLHDLGRDLPSHCFAVAPATPQGLWDIIDIIESANLIAQEGFRALWRSLFGQGLMSQVVEELLVERLKTYQPDPQITETDLDGHLELYRKITGVDQSKVVLVAHSQGNLFANDAYRQLVELEGLQPKVFDEVPVATPALSTVKGVPHITLYGDIILWVASLLGNTAIDGTPCLPNPLDPLARPLINGSLCHDFSASYLLGSTSGPEILGRVTAAIPRPVAYDDQYTMSQGTIKTVTTPGVLENDENPGGLHADVEFLDPLPSGFAPHGLSGGFTFTPDVALSGIIQVRYVVHTTFNGSDVDTSDVATVTVVVKPVTPSLPSSSADYYTTTQGVTLTIPAPGLLENDTFPAGVAPVVEFQTLPAGDLQNLGNGAFSYTPSRNFVGLVTFTYLFHTPTGDSNVATVTIQVAPAVLYSLTDLGDLPGGADGSTAYGLNNRGDVVGQSSGAPDPEYTGCGSTTVGKPFIWTAGGMQVLRTPPLLDVGGSILPPCSGIAWGMNDRGEVVGQIDYGFNGGSRPFVWSAASGMQLVAGAPWPGFARDINNAGQVVGQMMAAAFRWSAATALEFLEPPGFLGSTSRAINDLGVAVGTRALNCVSAEILTWANGGQRTIVAPAPAGCAGGPLAINDSGVVVGSVATQNALTGFIWRNGVPEALGELPGQQGPAYTEASGVNNQEVVVGTSNNKAYVWTAATGITELNTIIDQSGAGWTLVTATAVNDAGQIVGYGSLNGGPFHAFLLTPLAKSGLPNRPPTAGFTMSFGLQSAIDGQTLSVAVSPGASASVDLSAAGRSTDPDGTITGWRWMIDGMFASNTEGFTASLNLGTHIITLVVIDDVGASSVAARATIIVASGWIPRILTTAPSARSGHAMAYDALRGEVVLFGGADANLAALDDTWVWEGTTWTQRLSATRPSPRSGHAMAYDAARGEVVLFGGSTASGPSGETWVWNGTTWTQKFPVNSPPARFNGGFLAYDATRQQVVLFGGGPGSPNPYGDTWVWDGSNWNQKSPVNSPPARDVHVMAFDEARGQVVLFGGGTGSSTAFDDTWVWDGTNWTLQSPSTRPPGTWSLAMAYDAARLQTVMFGGTLGPSTSGLQLDTWTWDGFTWTKQSPLTAPSGRYGHAMVYDAARGEIVLFGGKSQPGANGLGDTLVWQP